MADETRYVYRGTPPLTMLTILFIGLKLAKVIDWSWVWVFAPIWGQLVVAALALLLIAVFYVLERAD